MSCSGPTTATILTIDGGDADAGNDALDLDQSADTLPRKRQFEYKDVPGDEHTGRNVNLITDLRTGATFDNQDNLLVQLRQMDAYVVRGGSSLLDQTIVLGRQDVGSFITVGNIDDLGTTTLDDGLPDAFRN